jgi:hypothetical protein
MAVRKTGVNKKEMEYWSTGVLGYWGILALENWNNGVALILDFSTWI